MTDNKTFPLQPQCQTKTAAAVTRKRASKKHSHVTDINIKHHINKARIAMLAAHLALQVVANVTYINGTKHGAFGCQLFFQGWRIRFQYQSQAEMHPAAPHGGVTAEQLTAYYDLSAKTLMTGPELLLLIWDAAARKTWSTAEGFNV